MELKGKIVLISGGTCGIGLATAHALHAVGASVVVTGRRKVSIDGIDSVVMDVTDDASVHSAVSEILRRKSQIDVVINMAGNGGSMNPWIASNTAETKAMFDVHVLGTERVIRAVLPSMQSRRKGTIVNIASTVGWVPIPGGAAYSSAKAAVIALSAVLRAELASEGIDVGLFAPPHTSTDAGMEWPLGLPKIFTPEHVARDLVRMVQRERAMVVPGGNRSLLLLQRIWPRMAARIMEGIGRKATRKALERARIEHPRGIESQVG